MRKIFFLIFFISQVFAIAFAQEESQTQPEQASAQTAQNTRNLFIPAVSFKMLQLDERDFVFSPSANLQYIRIKGQNTEVKGPDMIMAGLSYGQDYFTQGLGPEEVNRIHGCSAMLNITAGKNSFMGMLASNGQVPFSSLKTLTGALLYSRQFVKTENKTFTTGLGLVVGDFDVNIRGMDIYFFPLPVFSFSYKNDILSTSISMMGPPSVKLALFPKSMFRFRGSLGLTGFNSIRDLGFDCAVLCYPFVNAKAKDLFYIAAGIMNKKNTYVLKNKTKYSFQYYSVYGEINATFASLQCGYNFDGKSMIEKEFTGDLYKGLFASLNLMFML